MPSSSSSDSGAKAAYNKTLERLSHIQSHLTRAPRASRLGDKVCIVTGVGSLTGIGRATVLHLAHEGAKHIYAVDYDSTNLETLKKEVEGKYPDVKVSVMEGDCANSEVVEGVVKKATEEEGRLDVFFANAAIVGNPVAIWDMDQEDWEETMRVNVSR